MTFVAALEKKLLESRDGKYKGYKSPLRKNLIANDKNLIQ
jgi:hypothetical protein